MAKRYWLLKSDPESFCFADLKKAPKQTTHWDGVRNFQARNFLRDDIKKGDGVLFYHSVIEPVGVFGTAIVVRSGYPDPSQFDAKSKYFDGDSDPSNPRWFVVDIQLDQEFSKPITLSGMRDHPGLTDMMVLRKGSRLSVQPVTEAEWKIVLGLGKS